MARYNVTLHVETPGPGGPCEAVEIHQLMQERLKPPSGCHATVARTVPVPKWPPGTAWTLLWFFCFLDNALAQHLWPAVFFGVVFIIAISSQALAYLNGTNWRVE